MMSSINPSIDYYVAVMSIAIGYAFSRLSAKWISFYSSSSSLCGELRYVVSYYSSLSSSFPSSISAFPIVLYSDGAGVVPNGNRR